MLKQDGWSRTYNLTYIYCDIAGIQEFLNEALASGAILGAICGTLSTTQDDVWSCVTNHLDDDMAGKIAPFLCDNQSNKGNTNKSVEHHVQSGIDEVQ